MILTLQNTMLLLRTPEIKVRPEISACVKKQKYIHTFNFYIITTIQNFFAVNEINKTLTQV
jgi:hypothetical protein